MDQEQEVEELDVEEVEEQQPEEQRKNSSPQRTRRNSRPRPEVRLAPEEEYDRNPEGWVDAQRFLELPQTQVKILRDQSVSTETGTTEPAFRAAAHRRHGQGRARSAAQRSRRTAQAARSRSSSGTCALLPRPATWTVSTSCKNADNPCPAAQRNLPRSVPTSSRRTRGCKTPTLRGPDTTRSSPTRWSSRFLRSGRSRGRENS